MNQYLYDGADMVAEKDGSGNFIAFYMYGPGIDEPLARFSMADGSSRYYHADGLGSIIALTDASGAVTTRYRYSPYGKTETIGDDVAQPFRFTGREWDGEIGLYFYRARYYSPEMGRFITEDPLGLGAGDVNFYAYVGNDPVNYVDPLGLWSISVEAYGGYGGRVKFGRNPDNSYFGSLTVGVGLGLGGGLDPKGTSPDYRAASPNNGCSFMTGSIGVSGGIGVNAGPAAIGSEMVTGALITQTKRQDDFGNFIHDYDSYGSVNGGATLTEGSFQGRISGHVGVEVGVRFYY